MIILLLGCSGFIGSHLLTRLLKKDNYRIFGWDLESKKIDHFLPSKNFYFTQADVLAKDSFESLKKQITDVDMVINLAAICNPAMYNTRPLDVIKSNFLDVHQIVDLCATHGKWLIHASTSEIYGRTLSSYYNDNYADKSLYILKEDQTPLVMGPIRNQRWSYACAKQLLERYIYAHHYENSLDFTIIRPLNFFGPEMDYIPGIEGDGTPRVLACFLGALLNNEPMYLVDGGRARRTITSIHDAIDAIEKIIERPGVSKNKIYNIGNVNNEVSMKELAEKMRSIFAKLYDNADYLNHPIEEMDSKIFYGEGYEDCDRRMPDISLAMNDLDWSPKILINDILEETIRYYLKKHNKL
ncbi:MAG: NAD-dependent epimerase/dehydratase family protein [Desulfobacterales bacterium]|jgi:UDP-apiose/xylose synthase|nr:NAD-dependent epimerase/dehydratase family protein [Desulfobacterales bacterium]